jgi:hypothetical protein
MVIELVDRLANLVAIRRFLGMGVVDFRSLRFDNHVGMQNFVRPSSYVPFRRYWGMCCDNSRNVFLLLFMVLLGSYHCGALQEGSADVVVCLHVLRASVFSSFLLFTW